LTKALSNYTIKALHQTIAKNDGLDKSANEDNFICSLPIVVVSDGAGGTGLFADKWSEYLCNYVSQSPIKNFQDLCNWQESIWEDFYKKYKTIAEEKGIGGKFLEEGSSATFVALWEETNQLHWCTYGDSVMFHFRKKELLFANIQNPNQFNESPFLLNWKDTPDNRGFQSGIRIPKKGDKIIILTDTLAQYLLIAYLVCNKSKTNNTMLENLMQSGTRLASTCNEMIRQDYKNLDFTKDILSPIQNSLDTKEDFEKYTQEIYKKGLLGLDDYSMVLLNFK
jgi:hypothetical protein